MKKNKKNDKKRNALLSERQKRKRQKIKRKWIWISSGIIAVSIILYLLVIGYYRNQVNLELKEYFQVSTNSVSASLAECQEDIAGMTDIEEARNKIQEVLAEENTPYFLTAVYRRHLESSDAVSNITEKDSTKAVDEIQETETTKQIDKNETEKLEHQVQDIEDDMEQMQFEVQLYSPIMPSFRQVVQNAGAGEFTWSLHGRVGETNLYSKTSRYLLDKMETLGTYPEDTTESISGYLGGNYYFKSQYVVFDNEIYYIVSAMYADPFGWHTEGIWLFYGGLAVVFLIIIATILMAFISCRRTFSQMEDAERKERLLQHLHMM